MDHIIIEIHSLSLERSAFFECDCAFSSENITVVIALAKSAMSLWFDEFISDSIDMGLEEFIEYFFNNHTQIPIKMLESYADPDSEQYDFDNSSVLPPYEESPYPDAVLVE